MPLKHTVGEKGLCTSKANTVFRSETGGSPESALVLTPGRVLKEVAFAIGPAACAED
jgi:hypothetical protein